MNNINNIEEDFKIHLKRGNVLVNELKCDTFSENSTDKIKTISIIADRGFGKTTFLSLLSKDLKKEPDLLVGDIIDPINLIKDSENAYTITELALYTIYTRILNSEKNDSSDVLKDISTIVEERNNIQKEKDSKYSSGISILNRLNTKFNFKKSIDIILKKMGKKLVLLFDDFDLIDNPMVSKMLEELHEFIGVENIIFVFAYKERQLQNAVLLGISQDNKDLIISGKISSQELNSQVNTKLTKLFPSQSRIYLPRIEEFYQTESKKIGTNKKEKLIEDINEVLNMRITPARPLENINAILPKSPREYTQMLKFIEDINLSEDSQLEKINRYEKFILTTIVESDIDYILKDLVENYISVSAREKNGIVINYIRQYAKTVQKDGLDNACNFSNERDVINTSIADLLQTLNDLLDYDSSSLMLNYVYMLKLLISITLKKETLKLKLETKEANRRAIYRDYISLINGYFMPMTKTYYGNITMFNNINIGKFNNNDIDRINREELEIAFLTLISLHNMGPKFTNNSNYMSYVASLVDFDEYDVNTGKGNLLKRQSNSRISNLIDLYYLPDEYLFITNKELDENTNYMEVLYDLMDVNNFNRRLSNMVMRFEPLNIFLRYDVMIEHLSKGFDDLIIDNVFEIEEIQMYNFYRQGEYYSVANIIKRLVNKYYPNGYDKQGMILGKYISLPEDRDRILGNRLFELNTKGEQELNELKQICTDFTKFWTNNEEKSANLTSYEIKDLIIDLSRFDRKLLTTTNLNNVVVNVIKKTYEVYMGKPSKSVISTKIKELAKAINEGN